ncbi:hypothetical protein [Mycoplasmopsis arginini]|uniref:hypothetical protein n=1 Tax=Mycoplasmopsis arginini TaxID=2094 RepID=UPI00249E633E|nr:hypothetical protein [Mycoplasmopsis arginini]MDI3349101.1 hypothetical protein [Mycoplasmopsis arginini]MDI3350289.1 hypothetical protein [Mycoplasmopsis arginini]MDI3350924.1 hypothetical protein [Mycoplasmopsis arginini]MDI3351511.1 hypothetical protein [Mycoplasmopsis arginini]MDI3351951.1 hypothetical protein [Mycoplasmopsis arginini]
MVSASSLDDVATHIKTAIKPMIYPSIKEEILDGISVIKVDFAGTERPIHLMEDIIREFMIELKIWLQMNWNTWC